MEKQATQSVQDTDQNGSALLIQEILMEFQTEQTAENTTSPKKALDSLTIMIAQKNNDLLSATNQSTSNKAASNKAASVAAPPHRTLTSSGPLPTPNVPSTGTYEGPDASWPSSNEGFDPLGQGYLDKLTSFLQYLYAHPTDLKAKYNFLSYIGTLSQHGVLNDPDVQNILTTSGFPAQFNSWIQAGTLSALFNGFNGQTGEAGASSWLNAMQAALGALPGGSSMIQEMQGDVAAQMYALTHGPTGGSQGSILDQYGFLNGGTGSITIGGVTYNWNNPDDQFFINQYLANYGASNNGTGSPTPDPWYSNTNINAINRAYRIAAVNSLIEQYKNDPSIILCLFIMMTTDQSTQSQISGLADTTNLLSNMTNSYATPLLEYAQKIGSMTGDDAAQFVKLFYNGTNLMNMESQLSSLSGTWNSNVFSVVTGITVTTPGGVTTSLGQLMTDYMDGKASLGTLTDTLNSLNMAPTGSSSSSTNPGYQSLINSFQQGGGLITNTSQTLATQLGTATQNDAQYLKFGSAIASPTGGGFMQMIMQMVQNQKSN